MVPADKQGARSQPRDERGWSLRTAARSLAPRILTLLLSLLALLFGLLTYRNLTSLEPLSRPQVEGLIAQAMASATPPPALSVQVYQTILPSIVVVRTQRPGSQGQPSAGLGTGVVINADAEVLTALHVVDGASAIHVTFSDGTQTQAEIVASEPSMDIAVLLPAQRPSLVVPAVLGNPNALRVGDEAYVVGNPLGLTASLSAGVISGFDRSVAVDAEGRRFEGLIQFDAAVNPGASGGPLLNRYGQVVGIVTGLANPDDTGNFLGIGFAVPITVAAQAAGNLDY